MSREYRKIKNAILTLCDIIESCKFEKTIKEQYEPELDMLMEKFDGVKKELAEALADVDGQRNRWIKKLNSVCVDARLDESISEDLRERIIEGIDELKEKIKSHKDS